MERQIFIYVQFIPMGKHSSLVVAEVGKRLRHRREGKKDLKASGKIIFKQTQLLAEFFLTNILPHQLKNKLHLEYILHLYKTRKYINFSEYHFDFNFNENKFE